MARRVFLGLTEVAGYFSALERGLADLGIDARRFDLSANPLGYGRAGAPGSAPRRARLLGLGVARPGSWRRRAWDLLVRTHRWYRSARALILFPYAVWRFDTFILAGSGLFADGRELSLLRRLGKQVVVVFLGSDHRPPYLNGIWIRDAQVEGFGRIARDARRIAARVRRVETSGCAVVALPSSAQFHRRPYAHFLSIGFPFARPESTAATSRVPSPRVVALHCPTNMASKGTPEIRAAIATLRQSGLDIDYRELSGRPHAQVLRAIQEADFVIDEVYSDTPMAGFATESASFGRPAVVTGYFADAEDELVPDPKPPTLAGLPDQLTAAIQQLATDAGLRADLGQRAQQFVTETWDPKVVAERLVILAEGRAPSSWMVDPDRVTYCRGWGTDEALLRASLRDLISQRGIGALMLDDRPEMRERLRRFAMDGVS
jgi:hypothetical protein